MLDLTKVMGLLDGDEVVTLDAVATSIPGVGLGSLGGELVFCLVGSRGGVGLVGGDGLGLNETCRLQYLQ